jgi:hypothetical protein
MRSIRHLVIGLGFAVIASSPAVAQTLTTPSSSARWTPWLGCWQIAEESVEDSARLLAELATTPSTRGGTARGARVCLTPSADGGVTITTRVNDQPVLTETLVADGSQRPITEPGCGGWQRAEWSTLGARVFARAEIKCADQAPRTVSQMAALVAGPIWLDIQLIESEGRSSMRVRHYQRAAGDQQTKPSVAMPLDVAATPLSKTLTLAEIAEAGGKVPSEVLQAAVLELGTGGYDLKSKQLLELDAAGVPASVIDLMVALSYPKRFTVERAAPSGGGGAGFSDMEMWNSVTAMWPYFATWPYVGMWYMADPFFYQPYYYPYYGGGGFVVVDPGGGGGGTVEPSGNGRVVDGRGYTRIRRNEPATPRVNSGDGGNSGTASSNSGGSNSNSGGSGNSGVSSGGYSSGSSGGDRVAVPRPPGR